MKKCILGLKAVCDDCGACEDDRCELDPNEGMEPEMDLTLDQGDLTGAPDDQDWA